MPTLIELNTTNIQFLIDGKIEKIEGIIKDGKGHIIKTSEIEEVEEEDKLIEEV